MLTLCLPVANRIIGPANGSYALVDFKSPILELYYTSAIKSPQPANLNS